MPRRGLRDHSALGAIGVRSGTRLQPCLEPVCRRRGLRCDPLAYYQRVQHREGETGGRIHELTLEEDAAVALAECVGNRAAALRTIDGAADRPAARRLALGDCPDDRSASASDAEVLGDLLADLERM